MTSFMFLSQCRDTKAIFYLLKSKYMDYGIMEYDWGKTGSEGMMEEGKNKGKEEGQEWTDREGMGRQERSGKGRKEGREVK